MYNPEVYRKVNFLQRNDAKKAFADFNNRLLKWPSNGLCTVLDIGCGPGDVTHELILPHLPANFIKLDAIDISKEMLEYAKLNFSHPKFKYHQLDINTNYIQKFIDCNGKYDFIFSFYCIHWIHDQLHVMKNLYNLLNENGQVLLAFCSGISLFDAFAELAIEPKWSNFMLDYKLFLPIYKFLPNAPEIEFKKILKQIGFKNSVVKNELKKFEFENENAYRDWIRSVNPFIDRVPVEQQCEFIDEIIDIIRKRDKLDKKDLTLHYFSLVAYMKK